MTNTSNDRNDQFRGDLIETLIEAVERAEKNAERPAPPKPQPERDPLTIDEVLDRVRKGGR